MRVIAFLVLICAIVLPPEQSYAYSSSVISAFEQTGEGQYDALQNLKNSTRDPVLQSTAEWILIKEKKEVDFYKIVKFIDRHQNWPSLDTIKQRAEEAINYQVMERDALKWFYQNKPTTYHGVTYYLTLLEKKNNSSAKGVARDFWINHAMTRDQQKKFYTDYNKYLTNTDHQKRIRLLFERERYEQAQAVADLLGRDYANFVKVRIKLARNENSVSSAISNISPKYTSHPDLLYERLRWRRKNDMNAGAIEILTKAPSADKMHSPKDWWRERHIIIRRLIEQKKYQQAYYLASNHKQREGFPHAQAEFLSGWLALRFVNKPYQAFEHFERLYKTVETPISKSRGAYWAGRASEALGDRNIANQWYSVAAQYQETFYGQLAAEKTPQNEVLLIKTAPAINSQSYESDTRVKVAKLLHRADLKKESRLFLFRLMHDRKGHADLISLAELSRGLGHDDVTIKVAQEIQKKYNQTYHDYLYPRRIKAVRNVRNAEWALVHAIIRQESRFDEAAISPAGAKGLMQLMPETAKETAKQSGLRHNVALLTTNAQHNITLGSQYISQLIRGFGGNYAMAAAGYNAGPNRVHRWAQENGNPQRGQIDLVDWIELIPIYETRNYVQRVLEGTHVYRQYLHGIQPASRNQIHLVAK